MSFDSPNKADVQAGTKRLDELKEGGITAQELKELNGMKLQWMRDWVAKEQQALALVEPKEPNASAPHEARVQWNIDNKAYLEMKTVLTNFDTAIRNLKASYEVSRKKIQGAAQDDLAALDAALKDTVKKDVAAGDANGDNVVAAKKEEGAAWAKTAEAKTAVPSPKGDGSWEWIAGAKAMLNDTTPVEKAKAPADIEKSNAMEKRSMNAMNKNKPTLDKVSNSLSSPDTEAKKSDFNETKRLLDQAFKAPNDTNVRALQEDLIGYDGINIAVDGEFGWKTLAALRSVAGIEAPKGQKTAPTASVKPAAAPVKSAEAPAVAPAPAAPPVKAAEANTAEAPVQYANLTDLTNHTAVSA